MSTSCCKECKDKQKRFQILKADLEFQIKRIREDVAQEKVLLQIHFQRQQKKNIEKCQREKQQKQDQNKNWITKYDNMVVTYQTQFKKTHQKYQVQVSNLKQQLLRDYEVRQLQKLALLKIKVENMAKEHNGEVNSIKEKHNLELNLIKRENEKIVNDLTDSHIQKINEITFEHEEKVKKLRKDIDLVATEKQDLTKQAHQKQTSLYQQLYHRKQETINLNYQIQQLNVSIKNYQEEIKSKNVQIQILKEKHQQQVQNIKRQYLSEKSAIIQDFKCQIEELLLKKLEDCVNFEQNVKEIQVKRQNQLKIYQTYIEEVKQLVQERPSRNQDVQQITILKDLLNKKQKQIQKVNQQAKSYRLQLDYKEQTFNRIFKSNTNPLNIEKIGKKKEFKLSRTSAICRQNIKYNSILTMQAINTTGCEIRKDKSTQAKTNKMF